MQTFTISLLVNVILVIALLSVVFGPKLINYINKYKSNREKRLETKIKKIVNTYLKELQND